jgi:hypothetical protein
MVERWDGFQLSLPVLPVVDDAWERLQNDWHSDEAHRKFLELSASCDGLDVAAAHYRTARRDLTFGADDTRAETGLRRAASMAENLYATRAQAARTRMPSGWSRVVGLVGAILIVLVGMGAAFLLLTR